MNQHLFSEIMSSLPLWLFRDLGRQWSAVPFPISSTARQKAARMADLCHNTERRETIRRQSIGNNRRVRLFEASGIFTRFRGERLLESDSRQNGRGGRFGRLQVGRFECCAPVRAAEAMTQLWGEEVAGVEPRELAGAISREGDNPANRGLRQYLREVFDLLEDALAIEEADNGR